MRHLVIALFALLPVAAAAQQTAPPPGLDLPPPLLPSPSLPPGLLPATPDVEPAPQTEAPRAERPQRPQPPTLDELYARLRDAKDARAAAVAAHQIEQRWHASGSDTIDLLMSRVGMAIVEKNNALALDILDAMIALKPDYAEAYNKRATIHFLAKDFGHALADLERVLALEPRHFGALLGLGAILSEYGDEKRAAAVFRRALAIHPYLDGVAKKLEDIRKETEGRPT